MYLLIDIGNTRTKYGCHDGRQWLFRGVQTEEKPALPPTFMPTRILVSSVAQPEREAGLRRQLGHLNVAIESLRASAESCGLRCAYDDPAALGPDRWAAAIAAWLYSRQDCLVVNAGTATTIDLVREPGCFEGGCILPGLSLMQESLFQGTARLPKAKGSLQIPARNTQDAIYSGCVLAQVGAIREMARELAPTSPILLSGGNANILRSQLGQTCQLHPWLVLDGLLAVAQNTAKST